MPRATRISVLLDAQERKRLASIAGVNSRTVAQEAAIAIRWYMASVSAQVMNHTQTKEH